MTIIICAVIFEVIIPTMSLTWDSYALTCEGRILFWLIACYVYSSRKPIFVRGLLLFLCLCQAWTVVVYFFSAINNPLSIGTISSVSISATIVFLWFIFRDHEKPQGSIPSSDIDRAKNYILIRKPCPPHFKDVVLSFLGKPAGSIAIYLDGDLYGFKKDSLYYQKKGFSSLLKSNKYAIEIEVGDIVEAKRIMELSIGAKYHPLSCNCVGVLSGFCDHIGLNLNPLQRIIPGLFVAQLSRVSHG